ncbi:transcriptional regulator PadR family protein [Natrinema pellirubrum DSM 15624]|uniref:PadR family transcriptional regulator n=3 Tax=Natrinema TaxID=88723 RepID=A0A1S8AY87_9EURY|nr:MULTISPECIES: PadR family transcriptional regulator [Natrinema]ELZ11414.1 transcriptional regulator PadR family protein [Natrinema thermotolerans DSM 11552]AGB32971.1 putative transcriptional regulator [Natrinema pellirubrum DSM 15624]ELY75076.1 transcriptional regulator PadR family protein [Natrinema pellirubrum DSM 15624]OLZ41813.1 PadR family transcriptional regulator [Natrinema saccharevitans]QCC58220.1 PadR family transcriptional regulator [Natrinema thermotolerans]
MDQLTGFQRDLLYVIAGKDRPSGQAILDDINDYIEQPVTHGRLYPNLDTLVEKDLVEKGQLDRRTNYYALTPKGRRALQRRQEWVDQYVDV